MNLDEHKGKFGNQAENYTKYRLPYIEELHTTFFSVLPETATRILDIACGTGKSTEPLVRDGLEISGCDLDPLMIAEAKKQAELKGLSIDYRVADVEHLPYEEGAFDAVTVGTAFHWFVNEPSMTEIKRVLSDKGLLFIYWTLTTKDVPDEDSIPGDLLRKYAWDKVPSELRDLDHISAFLRDTGFDSVSTVRLEFSHDDTVEDQVGLMKTASSYEVLSDENKVSFIDELRAIMTEKLGDRTHFTFEEEIQVVYGFKA
jgi:SAM-dependent methyltransferase